MQSAPQRVQQKQRPPLGGPPRPGVNGAPQQQQANAAPRPKPTRINPAHIPRQKFEPPKAGNVIYTSQDEAPPLSLLDFSSDDTNGSSSCRFIRSSMYRVPATSELLGLTKMPMAIAVQPFAPTAEEDKEIPVVDFGTDAGPIRCGTCRGYINLFCNFLSDGKTWTCNLCKAKNKVPQSYECGVDSYGRRHDSNQRPELHCGSVDMVAGSNMLANTTAGPHFLFVLDVSYNAVQNGALTVSRVCNLLWGCHKGGASRDIDRVVRFVVLYCLCCPQVCINALRDLVNRIEDPDRTRIGVIAYNTELHYFNLGLASQEPRVVIVPDMEEPYAPLPFDAIMPPVAKSKDALLALLDMLPDLFGDVIDATAAVGGALASAQEALKGQGGRVLLFQSTICAEGPGALPNRDPTNSNSAYGTAKECHLYTANEQHSKFYKDLARSFAVEQTCVDIFAVTSGFIDVATMSILAQQTGGRVLHYENFTASNPAECHRIHMDIVRTVTDFVAFESVLKLRVGTGLEIHQSYGNFCRRTAGNEVYYPNFDNTSTTLFHLQHTGDTIKSEEPVYLQAATLYSNRRGERLIRVHNIKLPATDKITTCFRYSDLEVVLLSLIRQTCQAMVEPPTPLEQVRRELKTACVTVLTQYRKLCSGHSQPGQLILPEALKLLPIYILGLLKTDLLRLNTSRSGVLIPPSSVLRISADARATMIARLNRLSWSLTTALLYPRIFDLTDLKQLTTSRLNPNAAGVGAQRVASQPKLVWASSEKLSIKGMYLLENGDKLLLWLGSDLDEAVKEECFVRVGEGNTARFSLRTGTLPAVFLHIACVL